MLFPLLVEGQACVKTLNSSRGGKKARRSQAQLQMGMAGESLFCALVGSLRPVVRRNYFLWCSILFTL
jgi:hypothetical protein